MTEALQTVAAAYAQAARNPATDRRYAQSWASWAAWAAQAGHSPALPVPAELVASWLAQEASAGRAYATLRLRLTALRVLHARHGHNLDSRSPVILEVLAGIRRTHGTAQRQARPLMVEHLRAACGPSGLPATLHGLRDRALLLVGWAGALRASELVGLHLDDLEFDADGLVLRLRRSKTDQDGAGRQVALPCGSSPVTCPARTLRRWLDGAGIAAGPVFREMWGNQVTADACTRRTVDRLVRRVAQLTGFDPDLYSSHSLRAGFITSARVAGKSDAVIMRVTGHRRTDMLTRYDRGAVQLYERGAAGLGL